MKLVGAIIGLLMLLGGGQALAVPQLEYLIMDAPVPGGITSDRKAWELRESLYRSLNYRIIANNQSSFRYRDEEWMVHNLTTDSSSVSLIFDWHPLAGRFRFSGGVVSYKQAFDYVVAPAVDEIYRDEIYIDPQAMVDDAIERLQERGIQVDQEDLAAYLPEGVPSARVIKIRQRIEINANDLSAHARIRYRNVAPYLGLGWSNPFFSQGRLHYSFDIGVLYQIEPDIDLVLGGDALEDVKPAVQTWVNEWVFEQKLKLYKKMDEHTLSPRLGIGVSYRLF